MRRRYTGRKKKTFRKKRFYRKRRIPRFYGTPKLYGLPKKVKVVLKTIKNVSVAPAAISETYLFKLNSLFDPMGDAGGTQPVFFDQLAAIYNKYYVMSCYCKVSFVNETTNQCVMAFNIDADGSDATSVDEACSQPGARWVSVTQDDGSRNAAALSGRMITRRWFRNMDDLESTVSSDPTKMIYGHVYIQSLKSAGAANLTGSVMVQFTQTAIMFDRNMIADA